MNGISTTQREIEMSYTDPNSPYIQQQKGQSIGSKMTDLQSCINAMQAAIETCEAAVTMSYALAGYPDAVKSSASSESALKPVSDAIFPRLGSLASDLLLATKRANAAMDRVREVI